MKNLLIKDLLSELNAVSHVKAQKSPDYLEWINSDLVSISEEFAQKNRLIESYFIKSMNRIFKTNRFEFLLKRWLVEYFLKLFRALDYSKELTLEDNLLNRFGVEKYRIKFKTLLKIKWKKQGSYMQMLLNIFLRGCFIVYFSLKNGLKISGRLKKYKVMREAIWGMYDTGGYYFHDDFLVDGDKIKKEDLLLFSRGFPDESSRLKGYLDAKRSPYDHFDIMSLPLGIKVLFSRIIPKYIILSLKALFKERHSGYFSLYWSIYIYFIYNAIPYEKVFSNFKVISEFGHNYFSGGHVAESIICQNYGTKYYITHWSDTSIDIDRHITSFLGCDKFLVWGKAHLQGAEGDKTIVMPVGYIFKKFIKKIIANRGNVLSEMGIRPAGKIISFFDESFGGECKMQEEHFITFWETILKFAAQEVDNTILIKPKWSSIYPSLSDRLKNRFLDIKEKLKNMPNVYIIDSDKWTFIECIGLSDIVVTQGMTSSATIAIICGVEGLYLDQAGYKHPFSELFKNRIVFDDSERLLEMIKKIISGKEHPLNDIPEDVLRDYDAFSDDRGIDRLRNIIAGEPTEKIGIIVQARMGSTRLPGKIMRPIIGKPMLEILIERLKKVTKADVLIIATTKNKNDDIVEKLANRLDVICYRGSENDVLNRYYEAAEKYGLTAIVRITSDCPLMDPLLVDKLIEHYIDNQPVNYVANILKRTYPRGFDIEVFSFNALKQADKNAKQKHQREHVTPYIVESMKTKNYDNVEDASFCRLTVDTKEDFALISEIFEELRDKPLFDYDAVMQVLKKRPELLDINRHVLQKTI